MKHVEESELDQRVMAKLRLKGGVSVIIEPSDHESQPKDVGYPPELIVKIDQSENERKSLG